MNQRRNTAQQRTAKLASALARRWHNYTPQLSSHDRSASVTTIRLSTLRRLTEPVKLQPVVLQLQVEFGKPNPSIPEVKKLATPLRDAVMASIRWIGRKLDTAVDTAIRAAVPAAIVAVSASYSEPLRKALDTIVSWLDLVARTVF